MRLRTTQELYIILSGMETKTATAVWATYRYGDIVILWPVQLEEAHTIPACFGHVLDAGARCGAEDVWNSDFGRDFCHSQLLVYVEDGLDAHRSNQER